MKRLVVLALAVMFGVGAAAVSDPVKITGDKFVINDADHTATFTGKVVVLRTKLTVWAAKVVVEYGSGGPSDIKSFVATGSVRIKTPEQDATGQKAVYDPNSQLLHLTGNVIVINATGTVGSPELVVNLGTNTSTFTGSTGGRVTGVFTPK
ncbi:LptA/OstA family protein [Tardiphaga sp.]|jgi:lipopolysaccharide export system protein LptA|uniref:LptA/OstA family protein n=1 Tax=Tardiphaga sp. TaxID=1926292 RepID=UPI002621F7DA|nr:LptA/OstA family protein [Tardiphaga sp.]MDB5621148.1 LptA [Tardiphaga sp.]